MTDLAAAFGVAFAPQWEGETDPVNLDKAFLGFDLGEVKDARQELDLQYAQFFETALGKLILGDLQGRLLLREGFNANLGLLVGVVAGFEKVGQENMLKYITGCIRRGQEARVRMAQENARNQGG